jgi:hypothetical protein
MASRPALSRRGQVTSLVLANSGLPCDTFNIVCRARLAGRRGIDRCRDAVAHFCGTGYKPEGGFHDP